MLPVLAGFGAVVLIVVGAKYLQSRRHSPGPDEPPPTPTETLPEGGADAGTG
jgi:hypothetical protein